jgi:hypothetical protein
MAKKTLQRSFNDVLALLGGHRFDVAPANEGSRRPALGAPSGFKVSKYECAAVIAEAPAGADSPVLMLVRPGCLVGGEIAHLLDRGYQKFLKTSRLEIPATADHLRALHAFTEELNEAAGAITLYNQSLGTTSDSYLYDRVKGRE